MQAIITNSSIVIAAAQHNPSVITGYFLTKSGIIDSEEEIDPTRSIITPAFSQILLKNGTSLVIQPEKFVAQHPSLSLPFKIGQHYASALPFINCTGIGINFDAEITDEKISEWFQDLNKVNYGDGEVKAVNYQFSTGSTSRCIVNIAHQSFDIAVISFNFHYDYQNVALGIIAENQNFIVDADSNIKIVTDFMTNLLK